MAITVLADVILRKTAIAAGVSGRQIRQNRRVTLVSGFAQVNQQWEQTLREYDWTTVPLLRADWQYIESLHEITEGGALGFLLEDPKDFRVATGGVVDSLTSTTFQLYKRITEPVSSRTKDRKITRPRTTSFVLMISGVPTLSYTLDTATGIVTIPSAPAEATVTWTGLFYVPVHFMNDSIDWTMLRPGSDPDTRLLAGQSVVLQEIRE